MKGVFLSLMVMTTATTIVKADPVTCNNLKTMYQDSICCDNPTEEINCTHTLSINSDSTELSLEGGVLTLDLGTTIAATAANTAALNGGFAEVTSGTCAEAEAITSAAECEAAAEALGWSDTTVYTGAWSGSFPPGCSYWNSLIFNSGNSNAPCDSIKKCTCKTPGLVAAVADNSAAITANSAALNDGGFGSVTTGTCASHGYGAITTAAECQQAAVGLEWSDVVVDSGYTVSWSHYAPGCSLSSGGNLLYNTFTHSTYPCSSSSKCACQRSLVAAVAANSVAVAALNDGGLDSLTTGTCASHGYGVIMTVAECEAAAVALGWSDVTAGNTGSWSHLTPGCFMADYTTLYFNTDMASTRICEAHRKCACKTSLVGAVAANSAANYAAIATRDTSGNAATATKLKTKYSIGGVAFDGTHSINLKGVNIAGNQATSGNAATASYATTSGKSNVGVISNGHGSTVFVVTTPNYGGTGGGQPLTCSNGWYGLQYNAARNRLYVGSTGHSSDRRIKKNIRPMPDAVALDILRKLDVKYYNYIDEETMGSQNVIGFIAQEVLDILPSAASVEPGTIPYHRSEVDVRWGETASGYTMTLLSLSLEPGKYGFIMDDKDDLFLETLDGRTFKTEKKYSKVHLAVKEIDDFHRIDKAKIFAVGYAAVQQVDKNQQVLQDKVRTLEETIQELTTRLEALLAAPEV